MRVFSVPAQCLSASLGRDASAAFSFLMAESSQAQMLVGIAGRGSLEKGKVAGLRFLRLRQWLKMQMEKQNHWVGAS